MEVVDLNSKVIISFLQVFVLLISSFILLSLPPSSYFDVQREKKSFDLNQNESFVVINHTDANLKRITVTLTSGNAFSVNYSLNSDTPVQEINKIYSSNSHTFDFDGIHTFIIKGIYGAIKGYVEIDYGPLNSFG